MNFGRLTLISTMVLVPNNMVAAQVLARPTTSEQSGDEQDMTVM